MAKHSSKSKKQNTTTTGKGRVTPVQIAFIVDRYFVDNNFTETRSTFRSEASSLISKTNVQEAPKSLMSLDSILDEYIGLKEQKMVVEEEKARAAEMMSRAENLVMAMQNLMNAFTNSIGSHTPPPSINTSGLDLVPRPNPCIVSPPGYSPYPFFNLNSVPMPQSSTITVANYTTPSTSAPTPSTSALTPSAGAPTQNKRKSSRSVSDVPTVSKRSRRHPVPLSPSSRRHPVTQTPSSRRHPVAQTPSSAGSKIPLQSKTANSTELMAKQKASTTESSQTNIAVSSNGVGSSIRESSVAKNLFQQPSPPLQSNSPSPKTPPQDCICQVDNTVSPLEKSCLVNTTSDYTPQDKTPSNCAVITSTETVTVSPSKHITYSVERSHYYSSSPAKAHLKRQGTRDHVKGRLDFGVSDAPMSSDQTTSPDDPASGSGDDLFDDMPNFDMFGPDFSLSEFLVDMDLSCGHGTDPASHTLSGSTHEQEFGNSGANQTFSELQSSVTEILCEKDMNIPGQGSSTSVKSITKCITITSPAKVRRSPANDQENVVAGN